MPIANTINRALLLGLLGISVTAWAQTAVTFPLNLESDTQDRTNFQGRYVLRHPWQGSRSQCRAAEQYVSTLPRRFETEAQNLASLTGWEINTIRHKMASNGQSFEQQPGQELKWYQKLWKK